MKCRKLRRFKENWATVPWKRYDLRSSSIYALSEITDFTWLKVKSKFKHSFSQVMSSCSFFSSVLVFMYLCIDMVGLT
jgi:hypothetical protein